MIGPDVGSSAGGATSAAHTPDSGRLAGLIRAMEDEADLLDELRARLAAGRTEIVRRDTGALEANVQAVSRTWLALEEARHRRRAVLRHLAGVDDAPLDHLELLLAPPLPSDLLIARAQLRERAGALVGEIGVSRRVLRDALDAGDAFIRRLFSAGPDGATPDPPSGDEPSPGHFRGWPWDAGSPHRTA